MTTTRTRTRTSKFEESTRAPATTVRRDMYGNKLTPGYNVDPVDVAEGPAAAKRLGYGDGEAQMIVTYALQRWARGEEDGAERTWLSYYPRDFTSWRVIIASAVAS